MVYVDVGGTFGLGQCEVEEEDGFECVVEWNPV